MWRTATRLDNAGLNQPICINPLYNTQTWEISTKVREFFLTEVNSVIIFSIKKIYEGQQRTKRGRAEKVKILS